MIHFFFLIFSASAVLGMDFMGAGDLCAKDFAALSPIDEEQLQNYPATLALKKAMEQAALNGKTRSNRLIPLPGGKFKLQIEEFSRDSRRLNALMLKAVREGSIAEIDAGSVVGPKVISLLKRFEQEFVENNRDVVIRGRWIPWLIKREFNSQQVNHANKSQYVWTQSEKEDFVAAEKRFEVFDCYKRLRIAETNPCEFALSVKGGKSHFEYLRE